MRSFKKRKHVFSTLCIHRLLSTENYVLSAFPTFTPLKMHQRVIIEKKKEKEKKKKERKKRIPARNEWEILIIKRYVNT